MLEMKLDEVNDKTVEGLKKISKAEVDISIKKRVTDTMDGPKPQIRESDFGTFFRFLGVLLLRGGANAERRFGFEPLDLMPSVWQRG